MPSLPDRKQENFLPVFYLMSLIFLFPLSSVLSPCFIIISSLFLSLQSKHSFASVDCFGAFHRANILIITLLLHFPPLTPLSFSPPLSSPSSLFSSFCIISNFLSHPKKICSSHCLSTHIYVSVLFTYSLFFFLIMV